MRIYIALLVLATVCSANQFSNFVMAANDFDFWDNVIMGLNEDPANRNARCGKSMKYLSNRSGIRQLDCCSN